MYCGGTGDKAFQTTVFQLAQMLNLENDRYAPPVSNLGREILPYLPVARGSMCPEAQQLLQMLPRHRLMSSVISHNCVISACEKTAEWKQALAMLCLDDKARERIGNVRHDKRTFMRFNLVGNSDQKMY